ncbi:hypothetical protein SUS17_1073 [Sphingomonas sp. S17]|nr:hypothetical protein SUS17_1073 [Sphingomonas sp. S17]
MGRRCRNNADTHAGLDQAAYGIKAAKLNAKSETPSFTRCPVCQEALQCTGSVQPDKILA